MSDFTKEDEELIQHFIGLQTEDTQGEAMIVPVSTTNTCDWGMCLLARVVSNRTAMDSPFQMAMKNAWNAHSDTLIRPVAKNCFLIKFCDAKDRLTALTRGPWTFRGDLVAVSQVASQLDLIPSHVRYATLWVQLFNIPLNAFIEEGLLMVRRKVRAPLSAPMGGFVGGRKFTKIKVSVDLIEPLKDKVKVTHPVLGEITAFCVYEKVSRICNFCGFLGHELASCPNHGRLSTLMQSPAGRDRMKAHNLLSPTKGLWTTDATLIPRENQESPK